MMRKYYFVIWSMLAFVVIGDCNTRAKDHLDIRNGAPAKNIVLMIGDGMGPEVVGLAKDYAHATEERELWIEKLIDLGHLALVHTPAEGTVVTDSAAAATALATGVRTANETVSVDSEGKPLTTIIELAMKQGKGTGLVSTTRLTHATPACFAAHAYDRDSEAGIADQLLASGVDVMLGGGLQYWIPQDVEASDSMKFAGKSKRQDQEDLVEKARVAGYRIASNRDDLLAARDSKKVLGLFASSHLPYALDRRPDDDANVPSLAEMTETALEILAKNTNGFFLLIEGGRIDHAEHNNDIASVLADTMEFDETVGVVLGFAEKEAQTAIFVTADHATGAPCLSARYSDEAGDTVYPDKTTLRKIARQDASFESILRPIAKNASAEELKKSVLQHTGIEISDGDAALILKMEPISPFHVIRPRYRKIGGYAPLALGRVLGPEYGTAWAAADHYATPALLVGYGPHSDLVHGYIENTDIFNIMKDAGGL